MSPAHREPDPGDPPTRDALMDAALHQLTTNGVLAGLNLREVADAVGVTPANIYYYFGSREGLLRAALAREAERLHAPMVATSTGGFVDRRVAMFDAIGELPTLAFTALLALDDDKDYEPLPFLGSTRDYYRSLVESGQLPEDLDVEAVHLIALAATIGVAIYGGAVARQLDTTTDALHDRARRVFERMMRSVTTAV